MSNKWSFVVHSVYIVITEATFVPSTACLRIEAHIRGVAISQYWFTFCNVMRVHRFVIFSDRGTLARIVPISKGGGGLVFAVYNT